MTVETVTQLCNHRLRTTDRTVCYKWVNCKVHDFYLNKAVMKKYCTPTGQGSENGVKANVSYQSSFGGRKGGSQLSRVEKFIASPGLAGGSHRGAGQSVPGNYKAAQAWKTEVSWG